MHNRERPGTRRTSATYALSPQDQALVWHLVDVLLATVGLVGHFWLRRQHRARQR